VESGDAGLVRWSRLHGSGRCRKNYSRQGIRLWVFDYLSRGKSASGAQERRTRGGRGLAERASLDAVLRSHAIEGVVHLAALIEDRESMRRRRSFFSEQYGKCS